MRLNKEDMWGEPPRIDFELLKGLAHVAGGSIRRWFCREDQKSDIDIFPVDKAAIPQIIKALGLPEHPTSSTKVTDTYWMDDGRIIQIIKMYFADIYKLFEIFDYHHCMFGVSAEGCIEATEAAVICSLRKHLRVNKFQKGHELDSLRRAFKYQRQGYSPCIGTLNDLAKAMAAVEEASLEKQVTISPNGGLRAYRFD